MQYILSLRTLLALGSVYLVLLLKVLRLKFPPRILGASLKQTSWICTVQATYIDAIKTLTLGKFLTQTSFGENSRVQNPKFVFWKILIPQKL